MAYQPPVGPWVVTGLIVGASILAGSVVVRSALSDATEQLEGIKTGLAETKVALSEVAKAKPASAPKRRGPDPNVRYTLAMAGAPKKGPDSAKVKIVEFSDFQ